MKFALQMFVMLVGFAVGAPALHAIDVGDDAPEVKASKTWNDDGKRKSLSDFKGQYVLLNIWATW